MAGRFQGMRILITGASEGIGRAAARAFAAEGATVIAVARSEERLRSLASEAGADGRVVAIPADVGDAASMSVMAERVLREWGTPDVVVANAGIGLDALFSETTDEALREVFEVNVFGAVRTVRPFLGGMIERGSGRVLLISSVVGKRGTPHYSAYSASKFALHGMADALRAELRGTGVSVGVVCPSSTDTAFDSRKMRQGPRQEAVRVARHSAESVARAILRMAASRRREHVLSVEGKLMLLASRLAPGFIDWLLGRVLVARRPRPGGGRQGEGQQG
jgi:short-subunit dehydrogenase